MGYDYNKMTKEELLIEVSNNGNNLQYLNSIWRKDRDIILAAVKQNGLSLYYADYHQNDYEIVKEAIIQEPESIQFADYKLRNDRELSKLVIKGDPKCMEFLSEDIQNDKEIILMGLRDNFVVLEDMNNTLRDDTNFMKECCEIEIMSLNYCSDRLKNDWNFVKPLMIDNGGWLHFASEDIKDDRDYMYEYVTQSKLPSIQHISDRLKDKYGDNLIDFIKNIEKDYNLDKDVKKCIDEDTKKYTELFIKNTGIGKALYEDELDDNELPYYNRELNESALNKVIEYVSMKKSFFSFHYEDYVKEYLESNLNKEDIKDIKEENEDISLNNKEYSEEELERREIYKILGLPYGSLSSDSGSDWNRAKEQYYEDKKQKLFESMNNGEKPNYTTINKNNELFNIALQSSSVKEQDNKVQIAKRNDLTSKEIDMLIELGDKDVKINVCREQKLNENQIDEVLNNHTYLSLKYLIQNQSLNSNQVDKIQNIMETQIKLYKDLKDEISSIYNIDSSNDIEKIDCNIRDSIDDRLRRLEDKQKETSSLNDVKYQKEDKSNKHNKEDNTSKSSNKQR